MFHKKKQSSSIFLDDNAFKQGDLIVKILSIKKYHPCARHEWPHKDLQRNRFVLLFICTYFLLLFYLFSFFPPSTYWWSEMSDFCTNVYKISDMNTNYISDLNKWSEKMKNCGQGNVGHTTISQCTKDFQ